MGKAADYLDFSNNINGLGTLGSISKKISNNIEVFFKYSEAEPILALELLAKYYGLDKKCLAWGNGATQIFFNLPRLLRKGRVLIVGPTFWEYSVANRRISESSVEFFLTKERDNFNIDLSKFEKAIKGTSSVYICNPNNPTSTIVDSKSLADLIRLNSDIDFIVDETYLLFRGDYPQKTLINKATKLPNLYVVTSLSKFFALPGIRMGFLVAQNDNIEAYKNIDIPYIFNPLANIIVPILLSDKKYISTTRSYYDIVRKSFFDELTNKFVGKLKFYRPEANFVLAKILTNITSTKLETLMRKSCFLIRDASIYEGLNNKWIRFSILSKKENNLLADKLFQILN